MSLKLLTGPTAMPLTLAEAKEHLRVDATDTASDTYITGLIAAAVSRVDGRTGMLQRALMTQKWRLTLDQFPAAEISIPLPPLQTVEVARWFSSAGAPSALDYVLDANSEPARLFPVASAWPTGFGIKAQMAVEIDFTAGYANAAAIPPAIKHGLLLQIAAWYEQREEVIIGTTVLSMPDHVGAQALLSPYRVFYI